MSVSGLDESDYPYRPREATTNSVADGHARSAWWRKWLLRSGLFVGIPAILLTIVVGVVVYRAAKQAWQISFIESRGCKVFYAPRLQRSPILDRVISLLPDAFTDDKWLSDVSEVQIDANGYISGYSYHELEERDIAQLCAACRDFRDLKSVRVGASPFRCAHLADWPQLGQIEELRIDSGNTTDTDLAVIARMQNLKKLHLTSAHITTDGLTALGRLAQLKTLALEGVELKRGAEPTQPAFVALERFEVNRCDGLDDDALTCLDARNLVHVDLYGTTIGNRGLERLMSGGKLRHLAITEGKITDQGIIAITTRSPPETIALTRLPITDAGIAKWSKVGPFTHLTLDDTAVTDKVFESLNGAKALDTFSVANTKVTGAGASHLNSEIQINSLEIGGPAISQAGLDAVAKLQCHSLFIHECEFSDADLMRFANNDTLARLTIWGSQVSEDGLRALFTARRKRLGKKPDMLEIFRDPNEPEPATANSILDRR
jgi:hypothetical protein